MRRRYEFRGAYVEETKDYLLEAESSLRCGATAEAVRLFRIAIRQQPRNPAAYEGLGRLHLRRGEFEEAVAAFRQALILDPGRRSSRLLLGESYARMGRHRASMVHYRLASSSSDPE